MIIGISGKINSGKDTVGEIIQYLTSHADEKYTFEKYHSLGSKIGSFGIGYDPDWEIKKFADILKDCVCLILGCTREQLEDHEFKDKELGEEWWFWKLDNNVLLPYMDNETYYMDEYLIEEHLVKLTPRKILQLLGTDCGRQIIHPNIWVNAAMAGYNDICKRSIDQCDSPCDTCTEQIHPNWIFTDVRFPNEGNAIKSRGGIIIRMNRPCSTCGKYENDMCSDAYHSKVKHISETALDDYKFDYTINNDGTIEELVSKVKEILIKEKLIRE